MKLINKIYLWSQGKVKENHLKKTGNDIKCPNCNEWFSVSGVKYKHKYENKNTLGYRTCGQCKHVSIWSYNLAPVAILVDENEVPIKEVND